MSYSERKRKPLQVIHAEMACESQLYSCLKITAGIFTAWIVPLFPVPNSLESSANSFALVLGGGLDRPITQRIGYRIIQLQYLRTSLPNNSSNWQNNLQISTGLTFAFGK